MPRFPRGGAFVRVRDGTCPPGIPPAAETAIGS
jgi:hypothetical protein